MPGRARALFLHLLQRLSFKITLRVELAPLYFIRRNARERMKIASGLLNSFVFSVALHLLRITIQKNSFQGSHFTDVISLQSDAHRKIDY